MKNKILICIFSIIFGIIIGVNIPKAEANAVPNTTELMEMQSGQAFDSKITWESVVVNGKRLVIFKAENDENIDIELFW